MWHYEECKFHRFQVQKDWGGWCEGTEETWLEFKFEKIVARVGVLRTWCLGEINWSLKGDK